MKNSEGMFSNIKEYGSNWESRKREIFEKLDREVKIVSEIKDFIQTVTIENSSKEVEEGFNLLLEKIKKQFLPEKLASLDEIILLEKERVDLVKKIDFTNYDTNPTGDDQPEKLIGDIDNKIGDLIKDVDVNFLYNITGIFKDLLKKNIQMHRYKELFNGGNSMQILMDLKKARSHEGLSDDSLDEEYNEPDNKLELLKINSIDFRPFSVNLIIERDSFDSVLKDDGGNLTGLHTIGEVTNLIKDNDNLNEVESTIIHENNHSILDGAPHLFEVLPSGFFWGFEMNHPSSVFKKNFKEKLLNISAPDLLDRIHQELVADLDSGELLDFYAFSGLTTFDTVSENKINKLLRSLSTAGNDVKKVLNILKRQSILNSDDEIKDFCVNLRNRFLSLFVRTMTQYGLSREIALNLDDRAFDYIDILSHILKPTQYHHIPKFLEYKYGEENIENIIKKIAESARFKKVMMDTKPASEYELKLLKAIFGED